MHPTAHPVASTADTIIQPIGVSGMRSCTVSGSRGVTGVPGVGVSAVSGDTFAYRSGVKICTSCRFIYVPMGFFSTFNLWIASAT